MTLYLICFKNGVYDLKQCQFRDGRPEDNISLSTNIQYIEYNEDHPKIQFIYNEFKKIIPDDDIREYLLRFFGSCLEGRNKQQKFHIFTGIGSNGKSILVEFFEEIFGELACKLPIQFLCSKRGNIGNASPDIARTRGRRFVTMQEPESNSKLNEGLVKEITGNDKTISRELYKNPIEFIPQHKPILLCNNKPQISATDGGTRRRIVVVPFVSLFKDQHEFKDYPNHPHLYVKDDLIGEKLKKCTSYGAAILVHYYKKYIKEGGKLKPPKKITMETESYLSDNDIFKEFINNVLEVTTKETTGINELLNIFRQWVAEVHPENKNVTRNIFKAYLTSYYPKQLNKNGKWHFNINYNKLNNEESDSEDEKDDLDGV